MMLVLQEHCWVPQGGTRCLSQESLETIERSNELLAQGQAQSAELAAEAERLYQQNYEAGRAQGRAQAELEYAQKLIASALTQLSALDGLETQLVEVVSSALDKIMGATERDELIAASVQRRLAHLRQSKLITLMVAPEQVAALQSVLKAYPLLVTVGADSALDAAAVVVTTPTGSVRTKLELVRPLLQQEIAQVYG